MISLLEGGAFRNTADDDRERGLRMGCEQRLTDGKGDGHEED
jgi:hypothetical protein